MLPKYLLIQQGAQTHSWNYSFNFIKRQGIEGAALTKHCSGGGDKKSSRGLLQIPGSEEKEGSITGNWRSCGSERETGDILITPCHS